MYEPGDVLTLPAAVQEIVEGRYVFLLDRPCNPGWLGSMKLYTLKDLADRDKLREAKPTEYGTNVLVDRSFRSYNESSRSRKSVSDSIR